MISVLMCVYILQSSVVHACNHFLVTGLICVLWFSVPASFVMKIVSAKLWHQSQNLLFT